jgi:superfamily II DNA or RNA helicase
VSTPAPATQDDPPNPEPPLRRDLILSLRGWQRDAFREYFRAQRRDYLLVATPGAGKTAFALAVAAELLARREIAAITVVTPTEHLKHQWAGAAHGFGIRMDSGYKNAQGRVSADFAAVAVTYAQVAAHPALHRQRTENRRTLVIFDEIHHAGDALSWGEAVREAFGPARRRMGLTGTPFRSDGTTAPATRTARSTPNCAGPAADRRSPRPPWTRSGPGSRHSAPGPANRPSTLTKSVAVKV